MMKLGDTFTIAGCYEMIDNPRYHWYTPWRPRYIQGPHLRKYTVTVANSGMGGYDA